MFKAVVEAAAVSCGHRVVGASRGSNPRTPLVVREAVQMKMEYFRDMLRPPAVLGHRGARRAAAAAVAEAEQQVWEEFSEAMKKAFGRAEALL